MLFVVAMGAWAQENPAPAKPASQTARLPAVLAPAPAPAQATGLSLAPPVPGSIPNSTPDSIHGIVVSSAGEVYEGVRVTLAETTAKGAALPARTETTDSDGDFTFANVPAGAFKLTVSSQGFATKTVAGELGEGSSFDAREIVLPMLAAMSEVRVSASTVEIAEEQLRIEERQRVLGVIPNFYVTYDRDPAPLSTKQKYSLAWKSNIDPSTWVISGLFAGEEQAENTFAGYGQGAQGYAKRYGANFADNFIGTTIGGAVLPALFKQDPRYFYKGTGTVRARALYAIANAVICKGDNGRWQVNYSGILGSLAAGGISNLYYPASDRGSAALTFENAGIGIAGSAVANLFQEFVVRKFTPRTRRATAP
ncbi:MAG: carboxypeptidase-like regulatory domain-containing protein [Terracidiphilus sp.]